MIVSTTRCMPLDVRLALYAFEYLPPSIVFKVHHADGFRISENVNRSEIDIPRSATMAVGWTELRLQGITDPMRSRPPLRKSTSSYRSTGTRTPFALTGLRGRHCIYIRDVFHCVE